MLTTSYPRFPGDAAGGFVADAVERLRARGVEVEVIYRAAGEGNEVGGDFYDLFPIRDGAYGFAIGDVCGTGPEAAAVTGLARHALRLLAREGYGGPAVLERLNSAIIDEVSA